MLVIIEGIDFVGKSTISDLVSSQLRHGNIQVIQSRTSLLGGIIAIVVNWTQNQYPFPGKLKSFIFHLAYVLDYLLWHDRNYSCVFIQESYAHRVLAYDEVYKRRIGYKILNLLHHLRPIPTLAYYLKCSFDSRKKRWLALGSSDIRDYERFCKKVNIHIQLEHALERRVFEDNYIVIDTEEMTPDAISNRIILDIYKVLKRL